MREERGWESSGEEEDITAIGLLQRSAGPTPCEPEDDEVLVSEGEEPEEAASATH